MEVGNRLFARRHGPFIPARNVAVSANGDLDVEQVVVVAGDVVAVAARFRHRPMWTVQDLAYRMRDQDRRHTELSSGSCGVTGALDVSFVDLDPDQQRMFLLLGLHPGPAFDGHAAALANTTTHHATRLLGDLLDVNLLQQHHPTRYRFHDLVRTHVVRASTEDCVPQRGPARPLPVDVVGLDDQFGQHIGGTELGGEVKGRVAS